MASAAPRRMSGNRRGMETSTLVRLIILTVFLLLVLGAMIVIWKNAHGAFSGSNSLCAKTGGLFGGCT